VGRREEPSRRPVLTANVSPPLLSAAAAKELATPQCEKLST